MKVIGKTDKDAYICEVTHAEIDKYLNLYYGRMSKLDVGDERDLGLGCNHYERTKSLYKKIDDLLSDATPVLDTIQKAIDFVANSKGLAS